MSDSAADCNCEQALALQEALTAAEKRYDQLLAYSQECKAWRYEMARELAALRASLKGQP